MSHFEKIPDCVWKLFDEIMHWGQPVELLTADDRFCAQMLAWGWDPPLIHLGKTALTMHGLAAYAWRSQKLGLIDREVIGKLPSDKKRSGRPKKEKTAGSAKVLAGLAKFHGYEPGGHVKILDPGNLKQLAESSGVSTSTVSRELVRRYGKPGHQRYVRVCARNSIGHDLARWQGELPKVFLEQMVELEIKHRKELEE